MGSDLEAAITAVLLVNRKRAANPIQTLLTRIENPTRTLGQHLDWYCKEILPARKLAESTRYNWELALKIFKAELGDDIDIVQVDRQRIATYLGKCKPRMSNVYRSYLTTIFQHAVAQGLRNDNPVQQTIKREAHVQRQRLSIEQFKAIREKSDPWLQRTMDLALWSLQRRDDLAHLTDDNWKDGILSVRQRKVERHGTGLLRIKPGKNLLGAIVVCLNSEERKRCPYLVHRKHEKTNEAKGRTHHMQVQADMISRAFAQARDSMKEFKEMPAANRPTFHEIRSLGGDQYRKLGWKDDQIQDLMGHANENVSAMTKHYLDGHGEHWLEVSAA